MAYSAADGAPPTEDLRRPFKWGGRTYISRSAFESRHLTFRSHRAQADEIFPDLREMGWREITDTVVIDGEEHFATRWVSPMHWLPSGFSQECHSRAVGST